MYIENGVFYPDFCPIIIFCATFKLVVCKINALSLDQSYLLVYGKERMKMKLQCIIEKTKNST